MLAVRLGKQLMQAGPSQNVSVMGEVGALILPLVRLKSCIYIYSIYIYCIYIYILCIYIYIYCIYICIYTVYIYTVYIYILYIYIYDYTHVGL